MSSNNIRMENYKIKGQAKNLIDARNVVATIDRGLWDTEHNTLRNNVGVLYRALMKAESLDKDLSQLVEDVVSRFNKLETKTICKEMLDNKKLPLPKDDIDEKARKAGLPTKQQFIDGTNEDDNPSPKESDDKTAPAWFSLYTDKYGATDSDGKPTKAASQEEYAGLERRVTALENNLTVLDNDLSALEDSALQFNWKLFGIVGAVVFIILLILMSMGGMVFSYSLLLSAIIGLIVGGFAGGIAAKKQHDYSDHDQS